MRGTLTRDLSYRYRAARVTVSARLTRAGGRQRQRHQDCGGQHDGDRKGALASPLVYLSIIALFI